MTTFSVSGTDLATATDLGVVTGYTQAASDLTNKITASLQQAGLTVVSATFAPSEFDLANWWEALASSVGASNTPISFSGVVQVQQNDPGDGSLTSLVSAAIAGAVTTVSSVTIGGGIVQTVSDTATELEQTVEQLAQTLANLGKGTNTLAQVLPYLIIGGVIFIVWQLGTGQKTHFAKLL